MKGRLHMYDVVIIGAGVNGSAIARELSKYQLKTAVLDRCTDICEGTSKANSGIAHAGYDARSGTLKAKLNVAGSRMIRQLSKELDFAYEQNGSLILCFDEKDRDKLEELLHRGEQNGVEDLRIVEREELLRLEPEIGDQVVAALYVPSGGIVCPFGLTIALAENAAVNGVEFFLGTKVTGIRRNIKGMEETGEENRPDSLTGYCIHTQTADGTQKDYEARVVINAAGVYADRIHNMVSDQKIEIEPRKGEYLLCDKHVGKMVSHTLFQLPTALGKGILVTPTVHGNLLIGPTAEDQENKEGVDTSSAGLDLVKEKAALSVKELPIRQVITSFAGLRARLVKGTELKNKEGLYYKEGDFMIGEVPDAPGFIDVAGMESPGLSCAPATGEYVADLVTGILKPQKKDNFIAIRKGIPSMALATDEERHALIRQNPAYANMICRCEMVSEGEILDAIHRPLGATTTDGVKRRTRAGMGRYQSGFCNPRVVEILARELSVDESEIRKAQDGSYYVLPE